jgi:magnesium transporter
MWVLTFFSIVDVHLFQHRDLRKIDSRVPNLIPTVLVRKEAILVRVNAHTGQFTSWIQVNVLHIRALVKADTVILFDNYGSIDSRLQSVFMYHLEASLRFISVLHLTSL